MRKSISVVLFVVCSAISVSAQNSFGQQTGGFGQSQQPVNFGQRPGNLGQQLGNFGQQSGGMNPEVTQLLDQMAQYERQAFGVQPKNELHNGAMHGPTPASIPGGQIITTKGLFELIQSQRTPYVLFDVLGGAQMLPGATPLAQAAQPGQFGDQVSQHLQQFLQQGLQGNTEIPMIFYCQSTQCWMSYNAALRAINLGYKTFFGIEAVSKHGNMRVDRWCRAGKRKMHSPSMLPLLT
ncbi:hypothetical protein RA27_22840 [Ruegeria sp. ANG-R]|uniref:hypothetical protein n=1 Tax=Ruegeria sp. ANG-R TaxID=1577903 RepID=UPI00057CC5E3|nr:hypothetical protein [Ruegeria sp. ANG-R]KIC35392.1 hypothetical protein RA27_22840 [Ruegeria sp. ANG-R]